MDNPLKPGKQEVSVERSPIQLEKEREEKSRSPYPPSPEGESSSSDFSGFKAFLVHRFRPSPEVEKKLATLPPSEIYSLSSDLGISERKIATLMADFLKVPYLHRLGAEDILTGILPFRFCRRYSVMAMKGQPTSFVVSNPFDWELMDILKKFLRQEPPLPIKVTERKNITRLLQEQEKLQASPENIAFRPDGDQKANPPFKINTTQADEGETTYPIVSLTHQLLESAVAERASDIHIEPKENETRVRFRIDGDMQDHLSLDKNAGTMVISRFKALSAMDIAERRKPQDGSVEAVIGQKPFKLRLATTSTPNGESLIIRILEPNRQPRSLQELGMSQDQVDQMIQFAKRSHGLVLVVGPTGSGKTTTIYSLLSHIDCRTQSLISVEDPIEYRIPFANQQQVNNKAGVTFEALLKSAVRQDPDILFIGEIRDPYSARIALDFASTGHLTLTTLHTSNATTAIFRLERLEISRGAMADSLLGIVAQRLLKKLCPFCKEVKPITPEEIDQLSLFTDTFPDHLAHPVGCPRCKQTGYLGREGIQEVIFCDAEVAEMIRKGHPISAIRDCAHRRGVRLISHRAVEKVQELIFSLKEAYEKVLVEENLEGLKAATAKAIPAFPVPWGKDIGPPSILVVEDEPITQKMMTHFLETEGYRVEVAGDGVDALLKMGQRRFDLILSDVNIPNLDGFKLLEMVQQKGFGIPVIMVTGRTQTEDEIKGLELGASDYLKKPVSKELLLLRIRKFLKPSAEGREDFCRGKG